MKLPVLCLAVLSSALAVPNGYYHQEYNYKTSSSSFKNNELQHKTDDQGYYKKDGDLEGHSKPRVDSNSEHSEYVNPNLRSDQYGSQYTSGYGGGSDLTSLGHMRATNDYSGYDTNSLAVDGLAQNDRVVGSRGYSSGYSTGLGYGSNSYGASSSSSSAANLRVITSRLQQDLESDLQEAIRFNNMYAQSRVDIAQLERELRQNLTERLNNELIARYGQQMIRDGMSYSLDGGRLHSTANYNNQDLADLKSQVENTLMNRLRTQYHSSSSSSNQYYNQQGSYGYSTTTRPVYRPIYPSIPTTVRYPIAYSTASNYQINPNYETVNANARYTPVQQPESITNIATKVQNEMDQQLNQLLDDTKMKYFSSSSVYALTNTDVLLERLRNELRSNLTYLLDENIRRNYGTQQQRDGYMYSLGPSGQFSSDYNYALRDLENLKTQVETNLINKLNKDIEGYRSSWSSHQSYSSQSSYGNNYVYSSTPRYEYQSSPNYGVYPTTPRSNIYSLYTAPSTHRAAHIKNGGSYNYLAGSQNSGYESQNSGYESQSSGNMAQLQRTLQDQLSRQLQAAINQEQYSSYSTSDGGYSPSNYQTSLQELSNDLNRNLTRNLQEYSASGSYAAQGNFDSAQMERLKAQLQESLMSQLRQGLQQSFQTHNSYSSSSRSNYRQVRGSQDQGQYRSGHQSIAGEDCDGHQNYRAKRSYSPSSYSGYGRQPQEEFGQIELGQELESSDLVQEVENPFEFGQQVEEDNDYGKLQLSNQEQLGQQIDDSDLTNTGYGKLQLSNQEPIGQQIYNSDLSQQVEESGYGKLQAHNQDQSQLEQGKQVEDDYTGYGRLQLSNQKPHGLQIDDSDLTQQVEGVRIGNERPQLQNQSPLGQQIDQTEGQVEDDYTGYGRIQLSNQKLHELQIDDSDLTQKVEEERIGNGRPQLQNQIPLGQQIDQSESADSDHTSSSNQETLSQIVALLHPVETGQQVGYGQKQLSNQESLGQQLDDSKLMTQQVEGEYTHYGNKQPEGIDDEYTGNGKLQLSNQEPIGQQIYNSDLSQQVEESGYSRLEAHNQYQGQLEQGHQDDDYTGYGRLQLSNQKPHGQQIDQKVDAEHTGNERPQLQNQIPLGQVVESKYPEEAGQQIEDEDTSYRKPIGQTINHEAQNGFSKLHDQSPQSTIQETFGHQTYDSELTQQFETNQGPQEFGRHFSSIGSNDYGQPHVQSQLSQIEQHSLEHSGSISDQQIEEEVSVPHQMLTTIIYLEEVTKIPAILINNETNNSNRQVVDVPEPLVSQHNPSTKNEIVQSHDEQYHRDLSTWCDKYVDTSLMDAPWFLGSELKNNITKVISENGGDQADLSGVFEKVLSGIPNKMLTKCFQVEMSEPKYQKTILEGLNEYFNSLIKSHIENSIKGNQELEPKPLGHPQYTPTNNPIVLSQEKGSADHNELNQNQVESELSTGESIQSNNWCSQYVDLSLMDAPWSISKNLRDTIAKKVSEGGDTRTMYDKVKAGIPDDMLRKCFQIDTIEQNEQTLVLAGIEDYFQSLIKREIESANKSNKNQLDSEDINQQQVDISDNDHNVPTNQQPLAKIPTLSSNLPFDETANHHGVSPQTVTPEKKDELWPIIQELPGAPGYGRRTDDHSYQLSHTQNGYFSPNPHGLHNYGGAYSPSDHSNSYGHRYPLTGSYPGFHGHNNQKPHMPNYRPHRYRHVVDQNIESGGLHDDYRYSSMEPSSSYRHHYYQRPQMSTYSQSHGHNFETASNIEQLNQGIVKPVQRRPVYSGIKGRKAAHPMMQEPIQEPMQELRPLQELRPIQELRPLQELRPMQELRPKPTQELVHEPVQEPIFTPVSVVPPFSKNSEMRPEKIIAPEQVEAGPGSSPEELSWWQKFGNKVKQGAQNLKQKIVG